MEKKYFEFLEVGDCFEFRGEQYHVKQVELSWDGKTDALITTDGRRVKSFDAHVAEMHLLKRGRWPFTRMERLIKQMKTEQLYLTMIYLARTGTTIEEAIIIGFLQELENA